MTGQGNNAKQVGGHKVLEVVDGQVLEDGQPLPHHTLKARSIELIEGGWQPIEASETHRRYRRAEGDASPDAP